MTAELLALGLGAFGASLLLSRIVLRYAIAHSLLDRPNERSLHQQPTPRGGGLAIALVVLGGLALLTALGRLPPSTGAGLVGGGALVATVGWLDDRSELRSSVRLLCHAAAAIWTLVWLGGMPRLIVGDHAVTLGPVGSVIAFLAVVWTINFYNFMDGIDGLAASEAASVGVFAAILLSFHDPQLAGAAALIAGAAAGLLLFNWSPARIFMGDVGSGFLGFVFAGLALASENSGSAPALLWVLLVGVFFVDATVTLFRRLFRGERWYAAHRAHAYQRAVRAGWSHRRVTSTILALNVVLAGLGWMAVRQPRLLLPALAGGVVTLGLVYLAVERRFPM